LLRATIIRGSKVIHLLGTGQVRGRANRAQLTQPSCEFPLNPSFSPGEKESEAETEMKSTSRVCLVLWSVLLLSACGQSSNEYPWHLPPGFPKPVIPADNPMTGEKVALGRKLFYDVRLSGNQTQSCATCHQQANAFADSAVTPTGSTGEQHHRNSMSLTNVAYNATFTWAHSGITSIEQHIPIPLFGDAPIEMDAARKDSEILARLASDPGYVREFSAAFGNDSQISFNNVVQAIACFVRTLTSFNSPFDRYAYYGEDAALTESQIRGMNLFMSERLECSHCHSGFNFSQFVTHESVRVEDRAFHITGLYHLKDPHPDSFDFGLQRVTKNAADRDKFKAPTLRNVERTAPYMHDGSIATLEEVIDFYAAGGRNIESGPFRGDGRGHPGKSPFIKGFELSADEKADLLSFLRSLTDEGFLQNPDLANPVDTSPQ
jgi:cytochrome c peroxidase